MKPLSEQLRAAIKKAGITRYELSKITGVSQSTLSKFVLGQRPGLSFDAMDQIGEYLGLVIVKKQPKKKGAKRGNSRT
jgi:transcriptional regulator with XRE-family HTH domain